MISAVGLQPRARLDLLEQFVYLGEQESVGLYLTAVDATCLRLVNHPRSGLSHDTGIAGLKSLRRLPVKGFENYLVFYLPHPAGIEVVRRLHGARNIDHVFAQDESR